MSSPDLLDQAVEAMRLEHDDGPGGDADGTRWRIRASLERAQVVRGRLLGALVVVGVLCTGGVSWAYLSGRLEGVWPWLTDVVGAERVSEPAQPRPRGRRLPAQPEPRVAAAAAPVAVVAPEVPASPVAAAIAARVEPAHPAVVANTSTGVKPALAAAPPAPVLATAPATAVSPRAVTPPARVVKPVAPPPAIPAAPAITPSPSPAVAAPAAAPAAAPSPRVTTLPLDGAAAEPALPAAAPDLYRAAHQLHFHAGDPAAALAAWDRYLDSQPSGRFAIEARYNRAMALIRLRRYRDALLALQPFARGEIMPSGYRQSEAQRLSERLARVLASAKP